MLIRTFSCLNANAKFLLMCYLYCTYTILLNIQDKFFLSLFFTAFVHPCIDQCPGYKNSSFSSLTHPHQTPPPPNTHTPVLSFYSES